MRRNQLPEAPHCPDHVSVAMVPIEREIQRGYKFGKYAHLKKRIVRELNSNPRWKCPVENCKRYEVFPIAG